MADKFEGYVRRIDFEPKKDFLGYRTYAHVFLKSRDEQTQVEVMLKAARGGRVNFGRSLLLRYKHSAD